jgi:hypothetical protein
LKARSGSNCRVRGFYRRTDREGALGVAAVGSQVGDYTTQALDYLREADIAAEYLEAFGNENVLASE